MQAEQQSAPRLVDVDRVAEALDVSKPTIWRWLSTKPDFPRPLKIGENSTRFIWAEIEAWIAARAAERGAGVNTR